jgi:hypothetical protein
MTQRAVLTYKREGADKKDKGLRLYIRDGLVVLSGLAARFALGDN